MQEHSANLTPFGASPELISCHYYCLRSRPVDRDVVRQLVSRNVENKGIMSDQVTK